MTAGDQNYTVKEAADILKRRPRTLYAWIREGRVFKEYIEVPDGYLIPKREIDRILREGHRVVERAGPPTPEPPSSSSRRVISRGIE